MLINTHSYFFDSPYIHVRSLDALKKEEEQFIDDYENIFGISIVGVYTTLNILLRNILTIIKYRNQPDMLNTKR